jgi:RAB6A-GEF complex partner protein 1
MYWPIGAPQIYAATTSKVTTRKVFQDGEDAESHEATESEFLQNAQNPNLDAVRDDQNLLTEPQTPSTPTPSGVTVDQDSHKRFSTRNTSRLSDGSDDAIKQAEKEHILAIRISRTGHLFAVVTATSLTIWQTKARNIPSFGGFTDT